MGAPAVLVLDDGELDDIQQLLQEMAIPFARIRGGAIVRGCEPPRDLLIATPRRIEAVRDAVGEATDPPVRMMIVNEDSNAMRMQLRRDGFDYLVRRPVHAEALRLMLLHCCYKGEERRREPRVAVGVEVSYSVGLSTRLATLVDLSSRGCRLLTRHRIERGKRIQVLIPEALDAAEGGALLTVPGRAVHIEGTESGGIECFRVGISFEKLDEDVRGAIALIIEDRAQGPMTLRGAQEPAPLPATPPREKKSEAQPAGERAVPLADRRHQPRAAYSQTIPAFGERALRVLVGRDLSVDGMRVQPQPEIWIGDHLQLAIYGEAGDQPMLIWGRVERSDGRRGVLIRFDPLDPQTQARLERLVATLPAVESLDDSEAEAMGTVLGEILLTEPVGR
jgi:PilZ domain-containing protein